jgi:hypothetical protein
MKPHPLILSDWQEYVTLRRERNERSAPFSPAGHVNRTADGSSLSGTETVMQPR